MLVNPDVLGYRIPWSMLTIGLVASTGLLAVVLNLVASARKRPVVSGAEQMIGATGVVLEDTVGEGYARVHGEMWKVRFGAPLKSGQRVRVIGMDGLVLAVEPFQEGDGK